MAGDVILGNNLFRHMVNLYNETDLEANSILVPILNTYRGRKDENIIIKSSKQSLVPAFNRKIYDCEVSIDIGSIYIESDKSTTPRYISLTNALVQERAGVITIEFKN